MADNRMIESTANESIRRITLKIGKKPFKSIIFKKSGFKKCIQCGRCTASCPAAYLYADYRPRDLMRRFMLGDIYTEELNELIWKCGQCYSCRARCPRNCKAGLGVLALQTLAVLEGNVPPEISDISEKIKRNLYLKGETFLPSTQDIDLLTEFGEQTYHRCRDNNLKRERLGFRSDDARNVPVPEESLREIREILKRTGFGGL
ncbi:4Fe-4S dicluster domain-containing protein [Methanobacterium sp.]|uniref:4Fe-4S dicluster domain-containing protein n=1 Tax=Methanobacterium sp. TaxID=2164 RepID=UPI0031581B7C